MYALFMSCSGRPSTFVINPSSAVNPEHLNFFRLCGRVISKALVDNQRLDWYFTRSVFKQMLGNVPQHAVHRKDLEYLEPEPFKNLKLMLEGGNLDALGLFETLSVKEDPL
jgi:E3 ubiquitin-protein ligase HUWE1